MRDIKFRAWDKKHNEMVPDLICFYKDGGISHNNHFNSDISPFRGYMWDSKNLEIMQYTGLKDKEGVEIYEGDIIKLNGNLYEVWHSGLAFGLIDKNKDFFEYMCQLCDMNGKVYEVIGNIYENLELLKED